MQAFARVWKSTTENCPCRIPVPVAFQNPSVNHSHHTHDTTDSHGLLHPAGTKSNSIKTKRAHHHGEPLDKTRHQDDQRTKSMIGENNYGRRRPICGFSFLLLLLLTALVCFSRSSHAFAFSSLPTRTRRSTSSSSLRTPPSLLLATNNNKNNQSDEQEIEEEEEARLKILQARRRQIRQVLKAAEATRQFRLQNGYVPEIDAATGKPVKSDGQVAAAVTAFVLAAGAVALRIGGRAALVSAVGLDFLSSDDNPELKANLDLILQTAETADPTTKVFLFAAAWTAVKVLCFDAGGIVLALSAGILFGGVIQGALASAAAATLGSCAAYALAQLDTPVRQKALQLLEDSPSLIRGVEKVIARDGLKAVLTLRLAPILPIPIGLYNYVYGVIGVPLWQFAGGIFLGSIKPYLLDSYLGYFGKEVLQGSQGDPLQDFLLLGALGVSVLIGVFASQLASETWETVLEEVEAEKQQRAQAGEDDDDKEGEDDDDGIVRNIMGVEVPEFLVGFQLALRQADERIGALIDEECVAKVWNCTATSDLPLERDPARQPHSLEVTRAHQGIDLGAELCDGLVLSPLLFGAFLKYADPLFDPDAERDDDDDDVVLRSNSVARISATGEDDTARQELLSQLSSVKVETRKRLAELNERIRQEGK